MGEQVRGRELNFWIEQAGKGPDVLLIGGLGDTTESWQFQLDGLSDRYRLTAFDNPGAGRTVMADKPHRMTEKIEFLTHNRDSITRYIEAIDRAAVLPRQAAQAG